MHTTKHPLEFGKQYRTELAVSKSSTRHGHGVL